MVQRVAAPPAAALREDLLAIPWVEAPPVTVRPVVVRPVVRRAAPSPGCPLAEWDCHQVEWVVATVAVAPKAKIAKTAASRVVDSVVEQVVMTLARLANIPAVDKVPRNSVRSWTNRLAISTKRSVKNNVRLRRSVAIPKVLATAPEARVVQLAWVNRRPAVPVAVVQVVPVLAAAVARERVKPALSMA